MVETKRGYEQVVKSEQTIKDEIIGHIRSRGGDLSDWYVGIASDVQDRLFSDHRVNKENDKWVYRKAASATVARRIERYFIDTVGTDGGPGGGGETSCFVYAYRKDDHTNP